MSFEERLELIAQRHQALAETVEIVAGMQREAERREQERDAKLAKRDAKYNERFTRVLDVVEQLASVVQSHERRIQDLEH